MLDIQFIRQNAELVAEKSRQKGYDVDITQLLGFDEERRQLMSYVEDLRRQRNELTSQNKGQKPDEAQLAKGRELKDQLADAEHKLDSIEEEFTALLKKVPNMPADDVPVGASEDDNQVVKTVGEPTKFDFKPKTHWELGERRDWIDRSAPRK
jgi:seryl-tRNA synthetase